MSSYDCTRHQIVAEDRRALLLQLRRCADVPLVSSRWLMGRQQPWSEASKSCRLGQAHPRSFEIAWNEISSVPST